MTARMQTKIYGADATNGRRRLAFTLHLVISAQLQYAAAFAVHVLQ